MNIETEQTLHKVKSLAYDYRNKYDLNAEVYKYANTVIGACNELIHSKYPYSLDSVEEIRKNMNLLGIELRYETNSEKDIQTLIDYRVILADMINGMLS